MAVSLPLLVALLVLHHNVRALESAQCSADNASKFRFSVSSRRNATGHRLVGVKILEDVYDAMDDAGIELMVDVEQAHFRCNKSETVNTTAVTEAPPVSVRRPDYELFSELGYYKMHTKAHTWEQARLTCMQEGAHLLVVNSEGEVGVVKQFLDRNPSIQGATWDLPLFLVGFSDRAVEGQYVTVLGEPLSSSGYTKWASGEPQNEPQCSDPDRDCGCIYKDGALYMTGCSCKWAFICEQELRV